MGFKWVPFTRKQKQLLTWWIPQISPYHDKDAIIADGSIRSGKTVLMSLSFVIWSMSTFNNKNLGMAGKTIESFKRNVWLELEPKLRLRGYQISKVPNMKNAFIIKRGNIENQYYIFGGKDEASQDLVQGFTAAGFLFDEVSLMPESFVNQAVARCSVEGSKLWFNCNPQGPYHWFKVNWIDKLKEKNAIRIQFRLYDNPSLSKKRIDFYERMFSGVFYQRYILGLWVIAEGIIYDMFDPEKHVVKTKDRNYEQYYVSIDYGTQNATVFGLHGLYQGNWYLVKEYYHSGRDTKQKTDKQYADDLEDFIKGFKVTSIIIDPSAASFKAELRQRGLLVRNASNRVIDGIRYFSSVLSKERYFINDCCTNTIKEFQSYIWDEKAAERGEDKPLQENDHCMDMLRYFGYTVMRRYFKRTKGR